MANPSLLNVREHLRTLDELIRLYRRYGNCPLFESEIIKLQIINTAILRKHEERRKKGSRKDIYIEAPNV